MGQELNKTTFMKLSYFLSFCFLLLAVASWAQPDLENLSREEKNTMRKCPLHKKKMKLSDNYRANASDFRRSEDYPFAYQLNYRRYCSVCTKLLTKEEKQFAAEERARGNKASMQRCTVHNKFMKTNPEFSSVKSIKNEKRDEDIINAKQYMGRFYCRVCSKVYRIRYKDEE